MKDSAIALFCKLPKKGEVKTRLASETNEEFATKLYDLLLQNIVHQLIPFSKSTQTDLYFFIHDNKIEQFHDYLLSILKKTVYKNFIKCQLGRDIGERMANAFDCLFGKGYKKIVIVGSDIVGHLNKNILNAFEMLDNAEYVIGPSFDGGFYLIGTKDHCDKEVFDCIYWSSSTVLNQLKTNLNNKHYSFLETETMLDIDHFEDLKYAIDRNLLDIDTTNKLGSTLPI